MMEKELLNFLLKFFKNLGATTSNKDEILVISNVSEKFEKFYGKKSPYKFTTNLELKNEDVEYIENNSYLLKVISNYLKNSGETTLLKINLPINTESEIKKNLILKNSLIESIHPKQKFSTFFRFTFHTSFQYLNENEKLINEIYVHNEEIIEGDLNGYKVEEGNKSEIKIPDLKKSYFVAKEELKKRINNKTQEVASKLDKKLQKEINRIENHFEIKEDEFSIELKKAKEKLKEINKLGEKEKLSRQELIIKNLKEKLTPTELLNDKERSILIEKNKHSLNVNNKLFNTTLIYHPLCCADIKIKNEDSKRMFEIIYNPLTKEFENLICDVCKKPIKEIYLCKNGHTTGKNCITHCYSCKKDFCKTCLNVVCEICKKPVCNECRVRCVKCGKVMCKSHAIQDKVSKSYYCKDCLKKCPRCGDLKINLNFKISTKTKTEICEDCYMKEIKEKIIKSLN